VLEPGRLRSVQLFFPLRCFVELPPPESTLVRAAGVVVMMGGREEGRDGDGRPLAMLVVDLKVGERWEEGEEEEDGFLSPGSNSWRMGEFGPPWREGEDVKEYEEELDG